MIARIGPCIGITLFRWFQFKLELWFAPSSYSPIEHTHDNSDGEFFVIFGRDRTIYRKTGSIREQYELTGRNYFRLYSVRAGTPHGFSIGGTPMIWLCFENWKPGVRVTSVACDFNPT